MESHPNDSKGTAYQNHPSGGRTGSNVGDVFPQEQNREFQERGIEHQQGFPYASADGRRLNRQNLEDFAVSERAAYEASQGMPYLVDRHLQLNMEQLETQAIEGHAFATSCPAHEDRGFADTKENSQKPNSSRGQRKKKTIVGQDQTPRSNDRVRKDSALSFASEAMASSLSVDSCHSQNTAFSEVSQPGERKKPKSSKRYKNKIMENGNGSRPERTPRADNVDPGHNKERVENSRKPYSSRGQREKKTIVVQDQTPRSNDPVRRDSALSFASEASSLSVDSCHSENTAFSEVSQPGERKKPRFSKRYKNKIMETGNGSGPERTPRADNVDPGHDKERVENKQSQMPVRLMKVNCKPPAAFASRGKNSITNKISGTQAIEGHASASCYSHHGMEGKSRKSCYSRRQKKVKNISGLDAAPGSNGRVPRGSNSSIISAARSLSKDSLHPENTASSEVSGEKKHKFSKRQKKKIPVTRKGSGLERPLPVDSIEEIDTISRNVNFAASEDGKAISLSSSSSSITNNTQAASRKKNKKRNKRSSHRKRKSENSIHESGDMKKDKQPNSTSGKEGGKACEVEVCFNRSTEPEMDQKYLEHIMSNKRYNYEFESAKSNAPDTTRYIVKFSSVKQGKKAMKLLQMSNRGEDLGSREMSVRLMKSKVTPTDVQMVERCARYITEKAREVITVHDQKIKEIENELEKGPKGRKGRGILLAQFDEWEPKKRALNAKKSELEMQKKVFEKFMDSFQEKIQSLKEETGAELAEKLKQLRTRFGRERQQFEMALPIYAKKSEIIQSIRDTQVCIILAETGSGKSTQLTKYLYEAGYAKDGLIVCTQPRKVAATSLANYVSSQMGSPPGQLVSSIVGARSKLSTKTAILYMTDHALLNECLRDPRLSKYSCIIVDEAHERSIFTDLLLGMIKRTLIQRKDLRVIITSATIDPGIFMRYFNGCPKLEVSGRMFPVEVFWKETKSGENDYVADAVQKACDVHRTEGNGDVLVFLTSPFEIQKACEMMASKTRSTEVECLPLHGKLRPEDQQKVFQPLYGKRKVVFSTNCAETSVTIPGIKFVIDSGMVKEMRYDAKRNMNSLNVRLINKSSAEQRRGRAGRIEAGKCFRLYSEEDYQAMESQSTPEILRVHLGQAMLKLMELDIDPTMFDFVESPPTDSLEYACKSLISLGAVLDGRLTELGRKMARLPMDPRLAKLLIEGINEGVGKEALILASVATVNGSIFFRMGTEQEIKQHDMRKIRFCNSGGDLLTLLSIYQEWSQLPKKDKKTRNNWCYDNSLNAKAIRMADETIKELRTTLRQELAISNIKRGSDSAEQQDPDETLITDDGITKLQKIILACYSLNLCMFTGNERAGYKIASSNQCVQLHPSSSIKYLDHSPQFVVYEQLMKITKDYILNVTPVERDWVEEYVLRGLVPNFTFADLENLTSEVLMANSLVCSKALMEEAVGVGFRGRVRRDELEEEVSRSCSGALNVIETECDKGVVKVYVSQQHTSNAIEVIEDRLEKRRQRFRVQSREIAVNPNKDDVRVVIGRGGVVQHVLMPNMYRSVIVSNVPEDQSLEDVLGMLGKGEEILEHKVWYNNEKKMCVSVLFQDPEVAFQAVQLSSEINCGLEVKPNMKSKGNERPFLPTKFKVKVLWTRRQSDGIASIKFSLEDFSTASCKLSGKSYRFKSRTATFSIDEKRPETNIFIRGLGADVFEKDLKEFVEDKLNESRTLFHEPTSAFSDDCNNSNEDVESDNANDDVDDELNDESEDSCSDQDSRRQGFQRRQGIKVDDVIVFRKKSYESTEQECKKVKKQLKYAVKKIAPDARFEVNLFNPKPGSILWIAFLEFDKANDGYTVVRRLNGRPVRELSFEHVGVYNLTPQLHCRLTCLKKTYSAIEKTLRSLHKTISRKCSKKCARSVQFKPNEKEKTVVLELSGECIKHYVYLRNAVDGVISGDKLDCKASKGMEILLTKIGGEYLDRIERDTKAAIQQDWRTSCIFIFGSESAKTRAKTAINKFLDEIVSARNVLWEIDLRAAEKPRGLIRAIIKRFGPDLGRLEAIEGVAKVSLNLRNHVLSIQSTPEAKTTVEEEISDCIAAVPQSHQDDSNVPKEECTVCLNELEGNPYRLVCCGHAYCSDCISLQLRALVLPLTCANCDVEFVLKDFELLLNQNELRHLVNEAINEYVASHQNQVKYCPTPNCSMVYCVTRESQRFTCSACSTDVCTSCHMEYHAGMTCAMYKSEKQDGGEENLKRWMKKDEKNRKKCPKCNTIIEKNHGCNHMTCSQCREHFCWLCLARCGSEDGYYMHQRNCPRRARTEL